MTIGPVVLLGLLSIFFMLTTVRSSMMDEIEEGLKGTAAATLAAYDQNTGDYMESSNGDIWKGSYNISRSESLVDRIRDNTGMDVTFFYGDRRMSGRQIFAVFHGEQVSDQLQVCKVKRCNTGGKYASVDNTKQHPEYNIFLR